MGQVAASDQRASKAPGDSGREDRVGVAGERQGKGENDTGLTIGAHRRGAAQGFADTFIQDSGL